MGRNIEMKHFEVSNNDEIGKKVRELLDTVMFTSSVEDVNGDVDIIELLKSFNFNDRDKDSHYDINSVEGMKEYVLFVVRNLIEQDRFYDVLNIMEIFDGVVDFSSIESILSERMSAGSWDTNGDKVEENIKNDEE